MIRRRIAIVFALSATLITIDAWALRCGTRVVSTGDHQVEVRAICGEPWNIETRSITQIDRCCNPDGQHYSQTLANPVVYQDWIYNFGSHKLMQQLYFKNGVLQRIESLGYGY